MADKSKKTKWLLIVFIVVIALVVACTVAHNKSKTTESEALAIAYNHAKVEAAEDIPDKDLNIGLYQRENKDFGYDIQFKYKGEYYFYTIAIDNGEILGSEKQKSVTEFPVKDFPIEENEMTR